MIVCYVGSSVVGCGGNLIGMFVIVVFVFVVIGIGVGIVVVVLNIGVNIMFVSGVCSYCDVRSVC